MKIYKITEDELDGRLELDARAHSGAFCRYFNSEEEMPNGFYQLQDKIRDGLEKQLLANYNNGKDWDLFYVLCENWLSERIIIEISNTIVDSKLVSLILSHLRQQKFSYCVICPVYESMERGADYLGRFVINVEQIAVENSLWDRWQKQVGPIGEGT